MDLGIFHHLDHRDMPVDEFYESRLRLLEKYDAVGFAIAGTPERVREEIERQVAASTCTYFVVRLMYGHMTEDQASSSIDLFAGEVMPYLS